MHAALSTLVFVLRSGLPQPTPNTGLSLMSKGTMSSEGEDMGGSK